MRPGGQQHCVNNSLFAGSWQLADRWAGGPAVGATLSPMQVPGACADRASTGGWLERISFRCLPAYLRRYLGGKESGNIEAEYHTSPSAYNPVVP